ncbi:MAG TPA: TIGR03016 family PEP-CTERM system-associated outer membrane protein [Gammaproteobacteria bacterium]|nr:TIGR03016 family PEP-CTERM system-associated outer membrane protein [Gammaproteobacteria bacterium]
MANNHDRRGMRAVSAHKHTARPGWLTLAFSFCYTALWLMSSDAGAADWRVTPHLNLRETYTDNVTLAPKGQEQSELVTQINPGVSVSKTGNRLKVNATYTLQTLTYLRDSHRNNTNHQLSAYANAEWVKDFFYTDASASISQQNISLLGVQSFDNVNVTGNRADVRTYQISPYIRSRLGNFANYLVRYTHNAASTSAAGISDSQSDRVNAELSSARAFYKLGWTLAYSKEYINNTNFQDYQREKFSGELRYLLSRKLGLVGAYGYENNSYLSIGPNKPEGSFWNAGFAWTPSIRTKLEARFGRRYFGDTYLLDYSQRSRRTAWNVSYNEDITTTQSQFFIPVAIDTASLLDSQFSSAIPDPVIRAQFIEDFIVQNGLPRTVAGSLNFLTNQAFLQKRLQAAVSLNGVRNTMVFSLFNVTRTSQTAGVPSGTPGSDDFLLSDDVKQYGASAFWNLRLTPLTSSNLGVSYSRSEFENTGRQDDLTSVRLGVHKQLAKKMNGSADLRHIESTSNQAGNDYKENAVTVSLDMRF